MEKESKTKNQFGTFGGVFTPSILTILGVIMFMRTGFVVGYAGVKLALVILLLSKSITFLTGLSVSAISTNTTIKGGGAYYIISRVLGPKFGGAIGLTLFSAQALSVPFYILGFTEALINIFPQFSQYFFYINLGVAILLFVISYIGASWAIKTQYIIMAILFAAIFTFTIGLAINFHVDNFHMNFTSHFNNSYNFWRIFSIYFPAVTGIMAGINLSGDLKDPAKSIPKGTLSAIFTGLVIYAIQIILLGGAAGYHELIARPFEILLDNAFLNLKILIIFGVFAATLSSALGSFVGAPRILQALSRDNIFPILKIFGKGTKKGDEPRQALLLTFLITFSVIAYAGNNSGGGALNIVATIVTVFFLYAYGIVNLAGFVESFGANPSFRPRFRFFHWSTAFLGFLACLFVSILISTTGSIIAIIIVILLFLYINKQNIKVGFGDARHGFVYNHIKQNLLTLSKLPIHSKNWRPTLLIFSKQPVKEMNLVMLGDMIGGKRGIVSLAMFVPEEEENPKHVIRKKHLNIIKQWLKNNNFDIFPEVIITENKDYAYEIFLQSYSIGPIKPNLLLLGWPKQLENVKSTLNISVIAYNLGISNLFFIDKGLPNTKMNKRIDIWWRGQKNGSLMVLIAYLIKQCPDWKNAQIRILRLIKENEDMQEARSNLNELIYSARIDAAPIIIKSNDKFKDVVTKHSGTASLVILGFFIDSNNLDGFYNFFNDLTENLPTCILVQSTGEANLLE